jgi:hypothetical protein
MLTLFTINAIPDHRCYIEGVDTPELYAEWNSTEILDRIPLTASGELDSCKMFVDDSQNETTSCSKYVFDRTYYQDTRSIDWNMICDNEYKAAIAQTVYMLGVFTGAVVLGN